MKKMDLEHDRLASLEQESPPEIPVTEEGRGSSAVVPKAPPSTAVHLYGTLEIEGDGTYYAFLSQTRTMNTWAITTRDIFDVNGTEAKQATIVALLRAHNTGRMEGYGRTYLLTRLMSNISSMVYMAVNKSEIKSGFLVQGEYEDAATGSFIRFSTFFGGKNYTALELVYEGFRLNMSHSQKGLPVRVPELTPVLDTTDKAAVVANLGIKTASMLFRSMGSRLAWYKRKKYRLIDTKEKFQAMMVEFLDAVAQAAALGRSVLVGLDTETTGLMMYDLAPGNPLRNNVVAIPFSWQNDIGYVICTDMYYFSNVEGQEVYPLFTQLFRRNDDYTFQDIELDYCGKHYSFNRCNITVSGFNVMFDEMAFFTEGADIFFDEDGRQLFFNLDTDLQQGQAGFEEHGTFVIHNSLKMQTRRMIGDETLELDELFGPKHQDKYRYLQDEELALIYGGADADYTRSIVKKGISMTEPMLYKQYRKYDMTTIYRLAWATWKGMPVDTAKVKEMGNLISQDLEILQNFIYHYAWLANRRTLENKAGRLQELLGLDEEDVSIDEIEDGDQMFRYPFTPANHKKLLFQLLGYPVLKKSAKSGEPALDKFVLEKLMIPKRESPVEILTQNVMSLSDPDAVLIDKDLFNTDAYPLARVFKTYATYNKEYVSYYKPIIENDLEDRMFYNFTLARAATRRILSPGQTMKGSLKSLVIAPPGKIFMSFDASQIEYRHMASLAYIRTKEQLMKEHPSDWEARLYETSIAGIYRMMQKEEADYHIETAAAMTGVRQHQVTPKVRKQYKSIGFGIPYGLGDRSMCESLFKTVNEENMRATKNLMDDYHKKQKAIIDLLESARDSAFVPVNLSDEYRKYLGVGDSPVGIVRNFVGFYRLFILENLTRKRTSRIRRQAGNCVIQGGAAELFRRMLYNFHVGCCRAGIQNKVQWLMTVHDELDAIIDADIDIMLLIKVLYENCTLRYKDHIPYYIGINFGANWKDAKADANELPVIMVQRMIDAYDQARFRIPSDGNQAENLLILKRHYMCDRIEEELKQIFPKLGPGFAWTEEEAALVDDKFENYVVRAYLEVFTHKNATLLESLQDWQKAREEYGFGVSFLTAPLIGQDAEGNKRDFENLDFDLSLELLDDEEEEVRDAQGVVETWFGETSLFDKNASQDDILVDMDDEFMFTNDKPADDEFVINEAPTNAFDLYVSTKYVKTKVLKSGSGIYSAMTAGTQYDNREKDLQKQIVKHFSPGSDSIIIIGTRIINVPNVMCLEDDLVWLDKLLVGVP